MGILKGATKVATHRVNQLDVDLSKITDAGTREAVSSIARYVNETTQKVRTSGTLRGRDISNEDNTAQIGKDGTVYCRALNVEGSGPFKIATYEGSLAGGGTVTLNLGAQAKIIGVFGWSQYDGNAGVYAQMGVFSSTVLVLYTSTSNSIVLVNDDAVDTNAYRIVVFYIDKIR